MSADDHRHDDVGAAAVAAHEKERLLAEIGGDLLPVHRGPNLFSIKARPS